MYIFDLDDTLIHTFETATGTYYPELAKELRRTYPGKDVVGQCWGGELAASLRRIFGISINEDKALAILQRSFEEKPIEPVQGVQRIFEVLRKHEKFIGIYSSSHPRLIESCIRNSLFSKKEDFDFIFSTAEQQVEKPSPHIVFIMMQRWRELFGMEIKLHAVLVVGDSVADYLTARNAGADFAGVLTGLTSHSNFADAGVDSQRIYYSVKEALRPPAHHGVVAVIRNDRNEFLLVKESRSDNPYHGCWSGPHGRCNDKDILEEETVVRETEEECGIDVKPVRKLYTRAADTKVQTVSFWETKLITCQNTKFRLSRREVGEIAWFPLKTITAGSIPLYPGTKDFFDRYEQAEDPNI
jgi:phosphoglycolate phosphatase-like HAD superfamily hydrolase/8-oxo-dGTP pyrophosphatase MutT (NUDIX family)